MTPQSGNDELNSLGYTSSAPDFTGMSRATETKPQDEADLPALIMISRMLDNRKKYFNSTESISLEPSYLAVFTAEQQIAINKKVLFHIQELESLVNKTVKDVKEKLNDRD